MSFRSGTPARAVVQPPVRRGQEDLDPLVPAVGGEVVERRSGEGDPQEAGAQPLRVRHLGGFEQVLVTAAVLEDVPEPLTARIVHIDAGRIVEEEATTDV